MPGNNAATLKIPEKLWLIGILLLGAFHGLLYVFLVPPWQHYDEPGHFEYAWLIANRPDLPAPDEYDQSIRREIAASMIESGFFDNLDFRPNLVAQTQPVWIGISQTSDQPLYYGLVALPLHIVASSDVVFQLYLGRLTSLSLFIVSLAATYGALTEFTSPGNPIRLLVPLTLALLPGFVDSMTSLNNDVGAVTAFTLFLWLSLHLIHRGFHWLRLIALSCAVSLCLLTKSTVAIALALIVVPVILSLLRRPLWRWLSWGFVIASGITLVWLSLLWDTPQGWFSGSQQSVALRVNTPSPIGEYAFQIHFANGQTPPKLVYSLPYPTIVTLHSSTITLGAWMWTNQAGDYLAPRLVVNAQPLLAETIALTTTPTFFSKSYQIPADTARLQIELSGSQPINSAGPTVFFDGITLAEGDFSAQTPPQFVDSLASQGIWGERPFQNIVRSASAEVAGPRIHPRIEKMLDRILPFHPSIILQSIINLPVTSWYFRVTGENLLQTFWGKFSWGNIPLPGNTYLFLQGATIFGAVLAVPGLMLHRRSLSWNCWFFLGLAGVLVWSAALLRGADVITPTMFFPGARYAYPAILPTLTLLITGWMQIPLWLTRKFRILGVPFVAVFIALFLWLDYLSLTTIIAYFR